MTSTEARAMALAGKITAAVAQADTPNRNARMIVTDAAMWTKIATAIVEEIEQGSSQPAPEPAADSADNGENGSGEDAPAEDDGNEENRGRRRRRRDA